MSAPTAPSKTAMGKRRHPGLWLGATVSVGLGGCVAAGPAIKLGIELVSIAGSGVAMGIAAHATASGAHVTFQPYPDAPRLTPKPGASVAVYERLAPAPDVDVGSLRGGHYMSAPEAFQALLRAAAANGCDAVTDVSWMNAGSHCVDVEARCWARPASSAARSPSPPQTRGTSGA